jgi:hypothetical protein
VYIKPTRSWALRWVLIPRSLSLSLCHTLTRCSVSDADPLTNECHRSPGGCVALSFASEYPDFVDNLCVISCTGMTNKPV